MRIFQHLRRWRRSATHPPASAQRSSGLSAAYARRCAQTCRTHMSDSEQQARTKNNDRPCFVYCSVCAFEGQSRQAAAPYPSHRPPSGAWSRARFLQVSARQTGLLLANLGFLGALTGLRRISFSDQSVSWGQPVISAAMIPGEARSKLHSGMEIEQAEAPRAGSASGVETCASAA